MGFDAADTAARLGCADRVERVRVLDEIVDASFRREVCTALVNEVAIYVISPHTKSVATMYGKFNCLNRR